MKHLIIPYIAIIFFIMGCDKEDAWDIAKTRGEHTVLKSDLPAFNSINVGSGIHVVLRQGECYEVTLDGWKNLLPKIKLSVDDEGMLTIEDTNTFNFVRHEGNMTTVYLTYAGDFSAIHFSGNGNITSEDKLKISGIYILSLGASGSIDLAIETQGIQVGTDHENVASITIGGSCSSIGLTNWGYSPVDLSGLKALNADLHHRGVGNVYVNVSQTLSAVLYSIGDIYYKGDPAITLNRKGKGNLYKVEGD